MLTLQMLQRLWPHGNQKVPGLIEAIAAAAPTVFPNHVLNSDLTIAHAMAQFSHECGAGTEMVENIHYTPERAAQVWPLKPHDPAAFRHFADADDCLHKTHSFRGDPQFPIKLIDLVYGSRNGNIPGTHDGSTFIGRGLSQVTGRGNYQKLSDKTGLDLVSNPDIVSAAANALECGVADFVMCGCLPFAQADDIENVTLKLNGGLVGLDERKAWLAKWKAALGLGGAPSHAPTQPAHQPVHGGGAPVAAAGPPDIPA